MEICIPTNEFDAGNPKVGDFGEITLKVEVISLDKEDVRVLKHGPVKITKPFKDIDIEEIKNKIGTVKDTEMPIKKDLTNKESD